MLEAFIYRRADHCLFAWKAIRNEGRTAFIGRTKRGGQLVTGYIAFFDSVQMLGMDYDGEVWLVQPEQAVPYSDRDRETPEVVALMAQRRDKSDVPPLTPEQLSLYRELVARRRQS